MNRFFRYSVNPSIPLLCRFIIDSKKNVETKKNGLNFAGKTRRPLYEVPPGGGDSVAFLPKCAREGTASAPAARPSLGGCRPPAGACGGAGGGGHRISDITGGPRNPALTRVITGPNGPPDIYMISTSMPWVATAGNGWKRNVESGVNGAEIAAVLQQKMQIPAHLHTCTPAYCNAYLLSFIILSGRYCAYACMWYALSRHLLV